VRQPGWGSGDAPTLLVDGCAVERERIGKPVQVVRRDAADDRDPPGTLVGGEPAEQGSLGAPSSTKTRR
jgi:hypothetical protein